MHATVCPLKSTSIHQHLLDVNGKRAALRQQSALSPHGKKVVGSIPSGGCSPASAPRPRHPDALGRSGDRTWIDGRVDELNLEQTSDLKWNSKHGPPLWNSQLHHFLSEPRVPSCPLPPLRSPIRSSCNNEIAFHSDGAAQGIMGSASYQRLSRSDF